MRNSFTKNGEESFGSTESLQYWKLDKASIGEPEPADAERPSDKMVDKSRASTSATHLDDEEEEVKEPTTWPEMFKAWPKTTLCIVSNEFCERFSYYGMRTVLTFYLLNVLKFTDKESTTFFNAFSALCYLTPLLGSIIADGFIGKFWTIFSVSILYASGQIILAISSTKDSSSHLHPWLDMLGLVTIGFGTGGIKPCVAAFGGDQFEKGQERMLSMFFSMFYFSINAGSMISTFISPIFRSMSCMGQDSCFPLAFGVPAVLMCFATCLFMAGSFWYKKPPVKENVFGQVFRIIGRALSNKFSAKDSKEHWLDHYMNTHDCNIDLKCQEMKRERKQKAACQKLEYVDDVKQLLRLLVMFLPIPIFWALYDQQGSVWLIQGIEMDCRLWGNVLFLPDQVQVLNAVLILAFIPIFQVFVYPLASKVCELTPLRKMVAGGLLAGGSFLICGFVQIQVNTTLPVLPGSGEAFVSFMNLNPVGCNITVNPLEPTKSGSKIVLGGNQTQMDRKKDNNMPSFHIHSGSFSWSLDYTDSCLKRKELPTKITFDFESGEVYYVALSQFGAVSGKVSTDKPTQGTGEFGAGVLLTLNEGYGDKELDNFAFCRLDAEKFDKDHPCDPQKASDFYYWQNNYNSGTNDSFSSWNYKRADNAPHIDNYAHQYKFKAVKPGRWGAYKLLDRPKNAGDKTPSKKDIHVEQLLGIEIEIHKQGGVYLFAFSQNQTHPDLAVKHVFQIVDDNSVSILWQVPQIVVLTAAEILFSITGYEFAYSQCAPSMKSVVQAAWLLTTAIGDSIIVGISAWDPFTNMATQFFVYAGAMVVVILVFALMAIFYYDYKFYTQSEKFIPDPDWEDEDDTGGKLNKSFLADEISKQPYEDYLDEDTRF